MKYRYNHNYYIVSKEVVAQELRDSYGWEDWMSVDYALARILDTKRNNLYMWNKFKGTYHVWLVSDIDAKLTYR